MSLKFWIVTICIITRNIIQLLKYNIKSPIKRTKLFYFIHECNINVYFSNFVTTEGKNLLFKICI